MNQSSKVLVLLTGGTAGMRRNSSGSLAPVSGYLNESLQLLLQRSSSSDSYPRPTVTVIEFPEQLDSADMGPNDWKTIAEEIYSNYHSYTGFVLVMGTDTLAFCASALAFMFDQLDKPIVVTGAMLPIERADSDAPRNLMIAISTAALSAIPEVLVVCESQIYRGCRTKKMDSAATHAFESPNFPALAKSQGKLIVHRNLVHHPTYSNSGGGGGVVLRTGMDTNVMAIRLIPGFTSQLKLLEAGVVSAVRGVVLELFGAGNAPRSKPLIDAVKRAVEERGILVVICSQCPRGHVDLEAYANGRQLLEAGAISAGDMTFEASVTKLGFLLANCKDLHEVKLKMGENMRGELTPRLEHEPRFSDYLVEDLNLAAL